MEIINIKKENEIILFGRIMTCEKCKKGNMISQGVAILADPPLYLHRCNYCGNIVYYLKKYPYTELETKEGII